MMLIIINSNSSGSISNKIQSILISLKLVLE